jgi:hypothetical protein
VVGIDFWDHSDMSSEIANWGIVTSKDNAYDGREARVATGTDAWGYPVGGEAANYGDFLGGARAAHAEVDAMIANIPNS